VDAVFDWDAVEHAAPSARRALLADVGADVALHVFPRPEIARAVWAARIPVRIGTSHRWYHWLTCNALEHFSRKRAPLHEAQLNVRLARRLLGSEIPSLAALAPLTRLVPRVPIPAEIEAVLDPTRVIVVLHPGSSGSAREWPLAHWRALAESLDPSRVQLLISGSADEGVRLREWIGTLPAHVTNVAGRLSLPELIALLARVDGLVAASTGPLHLAAASGAHALGLFAPTPPVHPGRWAPLGPRTEVLVPGAPCVACGAGARTAESCRCLHAISVDAVRARVLAWTSRRP
jgi:ADP-heptose:LPS heptosyltransferase